VFPSYCKPIRRVGNLDSCPYKGRPVYSWEDIDQELRIVIDLYNGQLNVLEF
jgi:hypothetical protein